MSWKWKLIPYETYMEETWGEHWRDAANPDVLPGTLWRLSCTDPVGGKEIIPTLFVDKEDLRMLRGIEEA